MKGVEKGPPNIAENGVVRVTGPSVAPTGTVAMTKLPPGNTVTLAGVPLKATVAFNRKPPPKITVVPTAPDVGMTEPTVGIGVWGNTWAVWKYSSELTKAAITKSWPFCCWTGAQKLTSAVPAGRCKY